MKEQIKVPEKIQLSDSQTIRCTVQNTIRILTELVECGHQLDEKMKAMLNEIKENV